MVFPAGALPAGALPAEPAAGRPVTSGEVDPEAPAGLDARDDAAARVLPTAGAESLDEPPRTLRLRGVAGSFEGGGVGTLGLSVVVVTRSGLAPPWSGGFRARGSTTWCPQYGHGL